MINRRSEGNGRNMRQGILDIRRGAAWLAGQEEIDADQLGVFGISLGGITSALASTAEPRFQKICLMLAGGDMAKIAWESPEVKEVRERWPSRGGSKEEFYDIIKQIDPVTYGDRVRGRKILMLNASHDEVIPKVCTESLWHAFGEPEIVWLDAGPLLGNALHLRRIDARDEVLPGRWGESGDKCGQVAREAANDPSPSGTG